MHGNNKELEQNSARNSSKTHDSVFAEYMARASVSQEEETCVSCCS